MQSCDKVHAVEINKQGNFNQFPLPPTTAAARECSQRAMQGASGTPERGGEPPPPSSLDPQPTEAVKSPPAFSGHTHSQQCEAARTVLAAHTL